MDDSKSADVTVIKPTGGIKFGGKALIETGEFSFPSGTASQDIAKGTQASASIMLPPPLNDEFVSFLEHHRQTKLETVEFILEGEMEGNMGELLGLPVGNLKLKGKLHVKKTPTETKVTVIKRYEGK